MLRCVPWITGRLVLCGIIIIVATATVTVIVVVINIILGVNNNMSCIVYYYRYCIDNGAMIAQAGIVQFQMGVITPLEEATCTQRCALRYVHTRRQSFIFYYVYVYK